MASDSVAFLRGAGPARVLRRRALLRRLPARRRVRAAGPRRRRGGGSRGARALRHQRRHDARRGRAHRVRGAGRDRRSRSGGTSTTTAVAPWPTRSRRCARAPPMSRAASTATASGPATPTSRRSSPTSRLKMGVETIPADRLERLTSVAHHVAELVNLTLDPQRPYVGTAAFAHKAGLHTSALVRRSDAYEHMSPDLVGNGTRVVVSELAGRSTLQLKAAELGLELDSPALGRVLEALKHLEHNGYHFEAADGSLELSMRAAAGVNGRRLGDLFRIESFRVITDWRATDRRRSAERRRPTLVHPWSSPGELTTEATVKAHVGDERVVATAEGNGPVNALDAALRLAIEPHFHQLAQRAPDRLPRARARHRQGDGGRDPGALGHRGRRRQLVDDRRLGEHHRGVLAGARRRGRLRPRAGRRGRRARPKRGRAEPSTRPATSRPCRDPAQVRPDLGTGRGPRRLPARRAGRLGPHRPGESRPTPAAPRPGRSRLSRARTRVMPSSLPTVSRAASPSSRASTPRTCWQAPSPSLCAGRRSSGGHPSAADVELALRLFKYLIDEQATWPPAELFAWRREHFAGAAHDYWRRRSLADGVPEHDLAAQPGDRRRAARVRPGLLERPRRRLSQPSDRAGPKAQRSRRAGPRAGRRTAPQSPRRRAGGQARAERRAQTRPSAPRRTPSAGRRRRRAGGARLRAQHGGPSQSTVRSLASGKL